MSSSPILNYRSDENESRRVDAAGEISDHHLVVARLCVDTGVVRRPVPISYRRIKSIDTDEFERRLRGSSLFSAPATTADGFAEQLQRTVVDLLDEMAPIRRCLRRPAKATTKWLSSEAVEAKRLRCRLEPNWKQTASPTVGPAGVQTIS